ncbi:hypothetical protein B9G55_16180 [Saccharibacillus sp. O16]|nr:hypothetical protein B9G55_16180 [Saccharibacillus sp. O16]
MDNKAKELLEQKKANEHGGQLKDFVENQVEGTSRSAPSSIEATKSQAPDQQHHMKDQENRTSNHTGARGTDGRGL